MGDITIGAMTGIEAATCLEWARAEGWNTGLHDAIVFYQTDPGGFFAARTNGVMVGSISVVTYPNGFRFVGLLIVPPEHRGIGIGKALFEHAIAHSSDSNLGLDAVENMVPKYRSFGFVPVHRNVRFRGKCVDSDAGTSGLVPISSVSLGQVAEYDAMCFPSDRARFLELWTRQPDSIGLASLDGGRINGYGVIRRCHAGHKVGPLFADDVHTAGRILSTLTSNFPGEEFTLDVPVPNRAGMDLASDLRMEEVFSTVRMYTKVMPLINLNQVFGITSFELG